MWYFDSSHDVCSDFNAPRGIFRISFANQHRRESTIPRNNFGRLKIWNVPNSREKFTIISLIIFYSNEPENIKTWFDSKTMKKMFQKEYKGVLRKGTR